MKDINAHVEGVVKDQIAKSCRSRGIDPDEAGYAIGGHGQIMSMAGNDGSLGYASAWNLVITLRSKLIGQSPVGVALPVPGMLPGDDDFRAVVDLLVGEADNQRGAEFFGRPVPTML